MATPTRTINPLPFGDLEPHRFEDLIRQLAYDLRRWKALEATGRGGSDEGIDIRGIEIVPRMGEPRDADEDDDDDAVSSFDERLWIFQCKREKSIGPKKIRQIVDESLGSLASPPHGFVLAVACDISKAARDAFRDEMVARRVAEFSVWAKGELEDMLFQPKNDRLLFAYFGIALQPRRRNLSTMLRASVTKKKQLAALLKDGEEHSDGKLVLLRDPTDDRYPDGPGTSDAPVRWVLCRALTIKKPGHLLVLWREHLAAITPDQTQWDAISGFNQMRMVAEGELSSAHAWSVDDDARAHRDTPHDFWNEYIPEAERAYLKVRRAVPLDRILAIDTLGDGYFPIPHVFAEFDERNGPFTPDHFQHLVAARYQGGRIDMDLSVANKADIFPQPLPASDAPPLAAFDNTLLEVAAMTPASEERLTTLLQALARDRKVEAGSVTAETSRSEDHTKLEALRKFREWRDAVAMPVFSAFVVRLRASGHNARVVVRSSKSTPNREAFESVTLKIGMRTSITHNPRWRAPGHVEASISQHTGLRFEVSPAREESRAGAQRRDASMQPRVPRDAPSTEELETETIAMLERLHKRGY